MPTADYSIELQLGAAGAQRIAGVDEVGRGAWAGPVVVCAAVTDLTEPPALPGPPATTRRRTADDAHAAGPGATTAMNGQAAMLEPGDLTRPVDEEPVGEDGRRLADSKLLSKARREAFAEILPGWLAAHAIGVSEPAEIDEVGMTEALRRAAERALRALPEKPDVVLLDGKHDLLGSPWRVRCEVGADQRSVSVAAASVLAKVHRDRLMARLGEQFPEYGFADSAGYPSPVHKKALEELGPTPHHRLSWSYLDDLPRWRHLRKYRDPFAGSGQLSLL